MPAGEQVRAVGVVIAGRPALTLWGIWIAWPVTVDNPRHHLSLFRLIIHPLISRSSGGWTREKRRCTCRACPPRMTELSTGMLAPGFPVAQRCRVVPAELTLPSKG